MNKVVLISNTEQMPDSAFDFALMMNEQQKTLLTGVFLPEEDYWNTQLYYSLGAANPWLFLRENEPVAVAEEAILQFTKRCIENGIEHRVHEMNFKDIKKSLKTESRFTDLIIISNNSFYEGFEQEIENDYEQELIHYAECPVVIVPEVFQKPQNVILAYDGSASSVFAIRQFASLMPELTRLETLLVYVNADERIDFPDKAYIEELGARHFSNLLFMKLDIDPEKYFETWLAARNNTMLVTGAHGRSGLSELFNRSFVGNILKEHKLPVFIAHR